MTAAHHNNCEITVEIHVYNQVKRWGIIL
jgi:hypothetical protein